MSKPTPPNRKDSRSGGEADMRSDLAILGRLSHEWHGYWKHLVGIFLLSILATPLAMLTPVPMKIAVDSYLGDAPLPGFLAGWVPSWFGDSGLSILVLAAVMGVGVAVLSQAQALGKKLLQTFTRERMVLGLRIRLFPHVQRLSLAYHYEKGSSDSTYRVLYDTEAIPAIFVNGLIPLLTSTLTLTAMTFVIVKLSWPLAVIALAIAPVLLAVSRPFTRRLRREWNEAKALNSSALSLLQEVLSAVRVVKAFGREEREQERLVHVASEGLQSRLRIAWTSGQYAWWNGLLIAAGTVAVLFMGMVQVKKGQLSLGELLLILSYLAQLYSPLQTIFGTLAGLQSSYSSAERALSLLDEVPEVVERPNAMPLERARGEVEFRDVSFAYDPASPVLEGISFQIDAGTRLGIAGETGSGKTTMINLLTRLYDPSAGAIFLDGIDIRDYRLKELRDQFAIVLQDPVLFSKSVAENIRYAKPDADLQEIEAAARLANAHDFISAMPLGYETDVGERGMQLSGGERQRISIARAFLKNAPILVLDEPTSSVDVKTEQIIMEAVERLMEGRTTLVIAHRLSTLSVCDKVLVVQNGRPAAFTSPDSEDIKEMLLAPP